MQPSFFDYALEYQGGETEYSVFKWDEAVNSIWCYWSGAEKGIYKPNKGKPGRPSIPSSVLVGALFLQSWYGLSDPMTEELIHDRISFRKFLDIKDEDTVPDETTICKFRKALIRENLMEMIFNQVKSQMIEKNLILNEGTLVDATLIHASEPKRKKDNNGNVISNLHVQTGSETSRV